MVGVAAGSGQSGNHMEELEPRTFVSELNWSADTMLLGAAIDDCVAIFDMKKILAQMPSYGHPGGPVNNQIMAGQL